MRIDFTIWMSEVDRYLDEVFGVTSDTIPDYDYYALYMSNEEPIEAAVMVVDWVKAGGWL